MKTIENINVGAGFHPCPEKGKNVSGITLVALIITIIVMLILVGVSIQVVINSNLIGTAQDAANRTETAYEEEGSTGEITVDGKIYANIEDYTKGIQKIFDDSLPGNEYLKTFITEWTVAAGDTITLPIYEKQEEDEEGGQREIYFNYNFTIDYGDETIAEVTSFDDEDRIHTYETAGTYKIKIDGQCEGWSFKIVEDSAEKVTKLEQWGVVEAKHIDFRGCTNLTGEIPMPSLNSFNEVESFRRLFYGCTNLTGSIPSNLFQNATKLVTLKNAFNFAGVTGTIPEDLLANCSELTNVGYLFGGAQGLTGEIPENLLNRCNKLIYANGVFENCVNLTGSIPANLLKDCTELKSVSAIFVGCTGLSGQIPENLFINKPELVKASECFKGCSGLSASEIRFDSFNTISTWSYQMLEGIYGDVTIYIPKGSYVPTNVKNISSTANVTVIEYDV